MARDGTTARRRAGIGAIVALGAVVASPVARSQEPELARRPSIFRTLRGTAAPEPAGPTVSDLGSRIDHVAEGIRDDGIVAVKQPDVYSQARLTKYRQDFEDQMLLELGTFKMILAARIGRLDSATTTSTTTLGMALSPPGATQIAVPTPTVPAFGPADQIDFSKTPFGNVTVGQGTGNLGVEPTVFLDEKKRFLEHLNEIRRISLGPDQNDSSGYGLYLVRMPVSITPGECTYQGHGSDQSVADEHEFRPDFLPSTFRNLVVNDVVDQLGPAVFELIRDGTVTKDTSFRKLLADRKRLEDRRQELVAELAWGLISRLTTAPATQMTPTRALTNDERADVLGKTSKRFADFIAGSGIGKDDQALAPGAIAARLDALAAAKLAAAFTGPPERELNVRDALKLQHKAVGLRSGEVAPKALGLSQRDLSTMVLAVINPLLPPPGSALPERATSADLLKLVDLLQALYLSALTDDVATLDSATGATPDQQTGFTLILAKANEALLSVQSRLKAIGGRSLPSTRTPKQSYPIAPREVSRFFLAEHLLTMAEDSLRASQTRTPRATDVRNYLRQSLYVAYDAMSRPLAPAATAPGVPVVAMPAPLEDIDFLDRLRDAIERRRFAESADEVDLDGPSELRTLRDELIARLAAGRSNVANQPIAALAWAVAVDATLLDAAFREDAAKTFAAAGLPCPDLGAVRFYDPDDDAARGVFHEYVKRRWPIITFALDPVTDQQNIADSFNLKRDLQLALSFAFATGQINFNQVNTFRRQIEQSSDTIALNRTVTGYAHGSDVFGFRFTPRFQNPPNQRTNLGVITSQLISGGPGPDYGVKHSKLEPGIRELTAVILVPGFLPTIRMQIASNWFKLNDPEHLVIPTRRMMEQGRRVQELRQEFAAVTNAQCYRAEDLRVLGAKINQIEAMLPQQSRVVLLPFANTASGFELFAEGSTAMAPELSGFEGLDLYKPGTQSDIFVFGKYFSIHETRVIVGGVPLAKDAFTIVSREVLQVRLPDKALTTTTEDGKSYVEVHVATPNGISNRLLVPTAEDPAPAKPAAPKLDAKTAKIAVSYQWLGDRLAASADPDPAGAGIVIDWDEGKGTPPAALQVRFAVRVDDTRPVVDVILPAVRASAGAFRIDRRAFVAELLTRSQFGGALVRPASFPATVKATVYARPFLVDFSSDYQALADPLEIDFKNEFTGSDALQNLLPPANYGPFGPGPTNPPAPPDPKAKASAAGRDPSHPPTAAQFPADLGLPPLPSSIPTPPTAAPSAAAAMLLGQNPAAPDPATLQARLAAASAAARQPVSVNPTTVVVVPPAVDPKAKKDHHFRLFGRGKPSPPNR